MFCYYLFNSSQHVSAPTGHPQVEHPLIIFLSLSKYFDWCNSLTEALTAAEKVSVYLNFENKILQFVLHLSFTILYNGVQLKAFEITWDKMRMTFGVGEDVPGSDMIGREVLGQIKQLVSKRIAYVYRLR
jgi:hypothetical protein